MFTMSYATSLVFGSRRHITDDDCIMLPTAIKIQVPDKLRRLPGFWLAVVIPNKNSIINMYEDQEPTVNLNEY